MSARLSVLLRGAGVRRGGRWVLRDITWAVQPGQRWALLGANGAGKTQLLKLISGEVWPTPVRAAVAPRAYWAGEEPLELRDAKQRMAYLGGERQDQYARYGWNLAARDVVASGLHRTDLLLAPVTRLQGARVTGTLGARAVAAL